MANHGAVGKTYGTSAKSQANRAAAFTASKYERAALLVGAVKSGRVATGSVNETWADAVESLLLALLGPMDQSAAACRERARKPWK